MNHLCLFILASASFLFAVVPALGEPIKFTKTVIRDPAVGNMEGASLLIPDGWKLEGGFVWMPTFSMQANLLIRVSDPQSGAAVELLPSQQFNWPTQQMGLPMQLGSNWNGSVLLPPPQDAAEFVQSAYVPQALPHLRDARIVKTEDLPKYAAEAARSIPANVQATIRATRIRYAFQINGQDWEEDVYSLLTFAAPNGWTAMWWCAGHSMRAPAGQLDKLAPMLAVPVRSVQLTLDWFAMLEQIRTMFRQGNQQVMADQQRVHQMWREHQNELRQTYKQIWEERQASQDRQNQAMREILGGVETYKNPYESRRIELPQGYKDYWVNNQGTYLLSTDVNFDPRQGSTQEWKRMERFAP